MRGNKKILSFVMAFLMLFTTFFSQASIARAAGQASGSDKLNNIKSHYQSVKEYDAKRALTQKYGATISDDKVTVNNSNGEILPEDEVRVIVTLEGKSTLEIATEKKISVQEALKFEDKVKAQQANVIKAAKKIGSIRHTYQNALNGFSAVIKYKDIEKLRKLSGVENVTVANVYYLDMVTAVKMTNASQVWKDYALKGEGTVVSIVDTGLDYTHKDMKLTDKSKAKLDEDAVKAMGGPGHFFTDKVPYGYNFADMNDRVIPQASMHGMHVAGIVGANASDAEVTALEGVKGVAPEAQLLAMKVFTNNPTFASAFNDDIAAAIDDSVRHGADVVNMSLGSTAGFVDYYDPEQIAIKNATDAGVVVVVSGGNSSYSTSAIYNPSELDPDISVVGSPGLFPDTIQVASFENENILLNAMNTYIDGVESKIAYQKQDSPDPAEILGDGKYEVVYVGTGEPQYYPAESVAGKVVLAVRTGSYYYANIRATAEEMGAAGVIIRGATAHGDYVNMNLGEGAPAIPFVSLSIADGNKLRDEILAGKKIEVTFTNNMKEVVNSTKGHMSDFSSWGTSPDLSFKPEVTAPGGKIYSTVNNNKYEAMSGTSMAAPHTAGVTALVVQHLRQNIKTDLTGREFVELAKKLVINSAEPIIDPETGTANLPYLTRNQGAGLVQVDKAIETRVLVTDDKGNATIALKEVGNNNTFKINVENFGDKALAFNVKDNFGVLTNGAADGYLDISAVNIEGAAVKFDKNTVTVEPGKTETITVTLTIPEAAAKNMFAEGFITLESATTGQPNVSIPYMGFYGKWSGNEGPRMFDAPVWDLANTYFGETMLLSEIGKGDYYYPAFFGFDRYGLPIIKTDLISISPNGDDNFDRITPMLTAMRNVKELVVQVLDKDGNVVREVARDNNLRKNYTDQKTVFHYLNADWAWDGKIYDATTASYVTAPEGQYSIRVIAAPDFENAQYDERLVMPVKVDLTSPEIALTATPDATDANKFNVVADATDATGVQYIDFFADGEYVPYEQIVVDGNKYTLTLPRGAKEITAYASDFAGNIGEKTVEVNKQLLTIDIPTNENGFINGKNVTINYTIGDAIKSNVNTVRVTLDGKEVVANPVAITKFELKNLSEGNHEVDLEAVDTNGNVLASLQGLFMVDTVNPLVNGVSPETGVTISEKEGVFSGYLSEWVEYLKINGNEVEFSDKDLSFSTVLKYTEGPNRIDVELKDLAGNVNNYSYKVFVDTEAPELNVLDPGTDNVIVSKDTTTYKLVLNAWDTSGYRLYVNGNQIGYAESPMLDGNGTENTFEYIYNVPVGNSTVLLKIVDLYNGKTFEKTITFQRGLTSWVSEGGNWYYYQDGVKKTGWLLDGSTWYYLQDNGVMKTGWLLYNNAWYYLQDNGAMKTGWLLYGSNWYFLENSGAMKTGWVLDGNTWYYLENSGAMKTGWLYYGNEWYLLGASGAMQTGWVYNGTNWYYLYADGRMAHDTTIGGYKLGSNGAWIK